MGASGGGVRRTVMGFGVPGDCCGRGTPPRVTSKVHALVDGRGRPLEVLVTAGQANDSPILAALLGLQVPRTGPGPARTRPDAVLGDKAYSSRAHRALLRAAKVTAVIPEPSDQTPRGAGDGPCPVPGLGGPSRCALVLT